jgi:hypothetical protein
MNNNPNNLTVNGLYKIIASHDVVINYEYLQDGKSISVVAKKHGAIVYNDVIDESVLDLNKMGVVYLVYRDEYIKARVTKFVYLKLLEQQTITVRLNPIKKSVW